MKVAILLLAAGLARRMGTPKQLLPLGKSTIMGLTLDNITSAGIGAITVVLGAGAGETGRIARSHGARTVLNPDYSSGMASSLVKGLENIGLASDLLMVALADQPLTRPDTYRQLVKVAGNCGKGITVPVYRGKRGNPIIFKQGYLPKLAGLTGDMGGRQLLRRCPDDIQEVQVDDPGVVMNINTPGDYTRLKDIFQKGDTSFAEEGQDG